MTAQGDCVNKDPPAGWNYFSTTGAVCQENIDSSDNQFSYVFLKSGEYWFVENTPFLANQIADICLAGGTQSGVYVTNTTSGAFNAVITEHP
jgi:hypothetical protein